MVESTGTPKDGFWTQFRAKLWEEKFFVFAAAGAFITAIGLIYVVAVLSSCGLLVAFSPKPAGSTANLCGEATDWQNWIFWLMLIAAIVGMLVAVSAFILRDAPEKPIDEIQQYDYALLGLGFVLTLVGLLNFVALAGFSSIGILSDILDVGDTKCAGPNCGLFKMVQLSLIPGFAILGSIFFVAGSLRDKRDRLETGKVSGDSGPNDSKKVDLTYRGTKFWGAYGTALERPSCSPW